MIKRTRGRQPAYPQLKQLCTEAATAIKFEGGDDRAEIYRGESVLRGVTHCTWAGATEDRWFIKFSIGGKQFTLGAFALYEATRIYDALFVFFRRYRIHMPDELMEKSWLNWPRQQAEDDIKSNEPLLHFLESLQGVWQTEGFLKTAEQRADGKAQRARAYERRRSTAGMVETWGADLRTIIFELPTKEDLARVEKSLADLHKKLDELRRCVTIPTIEVNEKNEII